MDDVQSQDSLSTSDDFCVVGHTRHSPQLRISGNGSPTAMKSELIGILSDPSCMGLSDNELDASQKTPQPRPQESSAFPNPTSHREPAPKTTASPANHNGHICVRDVLYLSSSALEDIKDTTQILSYMRQCKQLRDAVLYGEESVVKSSLTPSCLPVVITLSTTCFGELRVFPASNEKALLRTFPLMTIRECVYDASPDISTFFAICESTITTQEALSLETPSDNGERPVKSASQPICHVFQCKTPIECEKIVNHLRQVCTNLSSNCVSSESSSNTLIGLRLELDILEEDGRGQFYPVPRERTDLFKLRTNVNKRFVISVTQTSGSVILAFQRCMSVFIGSGRYLKDEDFVNLELEPSSKCDSKQLLAITNLKFPLEGDAKDLVLLNAVTDKERFIFFTVGLHMMAHPVETPITLKLHLKARVFPDTERFWLYNKKPLVEECRVWLKGLTSSEIVSKSHETALTTMYSVIGVDYLSRTGCSTSHMAVSSSNDFYASGGVGLFQKRNSQCASDSGQQTVDEDDDEPLLSGTGIVSKEVTDEQLMKQWADVLAMWHSNLSDGMPPAVKTLVRRGIPEALRGEVWILLAGVHQDKERNLLEAYKILISKDSPFDDTIQRDMSRTFPGNALFQEDTEHRQQLFRVSKAYSVYDEQIGYVQGTSFLVAAFLLHMPEEHAFMVLVQVMNAFGLRHIISRDFAGLHLCLYQLDRLIMENLHDLWKHFNELNITPMMFASQWFITLFSSKFPLHAVYHILDLFLCEGMEAIFKVALALLKLSRKDLLGLDFDGVLKYFRVSLPKRYQSEKACKELLATAVRIKVNVKRMHKYAQDWQELRQIKSGDENPLENLETELREARQMGLRWEWENDLLATEVLTTRSTLESQLEQVIKERDMWSDKYQTVSQELYNTHQELVDTQEQRDDLLKEVEQVKQIFRSQVMEMEQQQQVNHNIINEYKEITRSQGSRLEQLKDQLDSAYAQMQHCSSCQEWLQEKMEIVDKNSSPDLVTVVATAYARRTSNTATDEMNMLRAQVQELEMELAAKKLELAESKCALQERTHEMNRLQQQFQRFTTEAGSGKWWNRFRDMAGGSSGAAVSVSAARGVNVSDASPPKQKHLDMSSRSKCTTVSGKS